MTTAYFNGVFLPKENIRISPDDRGFLFADGVYEVVRWYGRSFFDMEGHMLRLGNSLAELRIDWPGKSHFPSIAEELVRLNNLSAGPAMVYLQVTRGAAKRTHNFPLPHIEPTVYSYAWGFVPDKSTKVKGINVMTGEDTRWTRCNIKSVALLPNTLSFEEASAGGFGEFIFVRDGYVTEGSHSNMFFVFGDTVFTHPESRLILPGITRKNVIRMASEAGIKVREEAVRLSDIHTADEAFITNTSAEVTPVTGIDGKKVGKGLPGPLTVRLMDIFSAAIEK